VSRILEEKENGSQNERILKFICPICKAEAHLAISESVISQAKQLTTISIQKGEICEHHFQAFVDKNFKVRGYQKVDYEIASKKKFPDGNFIMKVIILGDPQVGKTSITRRFIEDKFDEGYLPTLQLKISRRAVNFGKTNVTFMLWDVGGQSTHMSPYRTKFYGGAQSAIIVVDRTRRKTLLGAETWYRDSVKTLESEIPYLLVGNKSDLENDLVVNEEDLISLAERLDLNYTTASAKTGENVNELFTNLTQLFFESRKF